ncbi:MAG: hypothetical protein M1370_01965 [Bacteroidetes bacterium]|nr:hypothetical protein [Bacteroidota bacterium]
MSEKNAYYRHLIAVGRVLGQLDALEQWLGAIKADLAQITTPTTQASHKESAHDGTE